MDFNVGDVVVLKSDGRLSMTVTAVENDSVTCEWVNYKEGRGERYIGTHSFPKDALLKQ